jgi:hypothetical protein
MAALPQLLQAAAAALTDTQHEPALAHVPQDSIFTLSIRYAQAPAAARRVLHIQSTVRSLLQLLHISLHIWPQSVDVQAASAPVLQACAAAIQHCSRCADVTDPDAEVPYALDDLMTTACAAIKQVCTAWEQPGQGLDRASFAMRVGHPGALQAICMLLMTKTLGPEFLCMDPPVTASSSSSSTARNSIHVAQYTAASLVATQDAWEFACTHQSDLSMLQQQALQELGCGSGRALTMYAAQEGLGISVKLTTVHLIALSCLALAENCPPLPQLDQPQQLQQLAEALAQLKEGDSPPCGSRLVPCAGLLWLVPAVMLEWVQKHPADGARVGMFTHLFSTIAWRSWDQVLTHYQFWRKAREALVTGTGQAAGQHCKQHNAGCHQCCTAV